MSTVLVLEDRKVSSLRYCAGSLAALERYASEHVVLPNIKNTPKENHELETTLCRLGARKKQFSGLNPHALEFIESIS